MLFYSQIISVSLTQQQILLIALLAPAFILSTTACTTQTASNTNPEPAPTSQESPETPSSPLKIAFIINMNEAQIQEQQQAITKYLSQTLKQPVVLEGVPDYKAAVDLLVEEKVQIARLGPLTYVEAKRQNPEIEPIVAAINEATGRPWYKSAIIVNTDSAIKTLDDLKGKRLGFVSPLSTSGYMFAAVHLLDLGFNFDSDFASVEFFKSHDKTLAALLSGQVDAIVIELEIYAQGRKSGKISDTYQVIWESEPIPESPIVVSQKLSPELINQLKEAFIASPIGMVSPDGIPSNGYTIVQDSDYERVKQVKQKLAQKLGNN